VQGWFGSVFICFSFVWLILFVLFPVGGLRRKYAWMIRIANGIGTGFGDWLWCKSDATSHSFVTVSMVHRTPTGTWDSISQISS